MSAPADDKAPGATELQSLHPNHVWQIDASLCVLYYLAARTPAEAGLHNMSDPEAITVGVAPLFMAGVL